MKKNPNICETHELHFEMYCCEEGCPGERSPMCPMCMCDHVKQHHVKATHIKEYVDKGLEKVREGRLKLKAHQDQVDEYHCTAEKYLKTKDEVQDQLETILQRLLVLVKNQQTLASDTNSSMLKCHENTSKAIKQCEHRLKEKINDPDGMKTQVESMVKNRNYLSALEEIEKTLNDDARFDDREIVEELATWKTLITSYQQQLQELDVTPAQLADYKKIYEQNGRLVGDNHQLTRMFFVSHKCLESLAECRDKLAKEQEEVQTTHDQLEKTRSTGFVNTDIEEFAECRAQRAAEQTAAQTLLAQHNQTLSNAVYANASR